MYIVCPRQRVERGSPDESGGLTCASSPRGTPALSLKSAPVDSSQDCLRMRSRCTSRVCRLSKGSFYQRHLLADTARRFERLEASKGIFVEAIRKRCFLVWCLRLAHPRSVPRAMRNFSYASEAGSAQLALLCASRVASLRIAQLACVSKVASL